MFLLFFSRIVCADPSLDQHRSKQQQVLRHPSHQVGQHLLRMEPLGPRCVPHMLHRLCLSFSHAHCFSRRAGPERSQAHGKQPCSCDCRLQEEVRPCALKNSVHSHILPHFTHSRPLFSHYLFYDSLLTVPPLSPLGSRTSLATTGRTAIASLPRPGNTRYST